MLIIILKIKQKTLDIVTTMLLIYNNFDINIKYEIAELTKRQLG